MTVIKKITQNLQDISEKYGLKILFSDYTNTTLISRIGLSFEIFIHIYVNTKKEKINLALVVAGDRIYGIDKEGGFYHEHPFENPLLHIPTEQIEIEGFIIKSLNYLREINLL